MFSPDCNFPDTADFSESGERSTLSEWTSLLIAWLRHFWEQSIINYTLRVNDENKRTVCSAHFQTCGERILSAYCRARKWFVDSNSLLISRKVISKSMGAECNIPIFQLVLTGLINAMTTWISRPCTLGWDPDPDTQGWGLRMGRYTITINTTRQQGSPGPAPPWGRAAVLQKLGGGGENQPAPACLGELAGLVNYRCINLRRGALLPNSPGKS